jgi:hypothetical protein
MRLTIVLLVALTAATALAEPTPSIKEDFKDAGRSVESGVKGSYEKAKDATVKGVGTALEKTGEGIGKAGEKIEGAGEATKEKVE